MEIQAIGKMLVLAGSVAVIAGVALMFFDKIPFLGKLPGDITVKRENVQIYFPIMSGLILSILVSAVVWLLSHFRGK